MLSRPMIQMSLVMRSKTVEITNPALTEHVTRQLGCSRPGKYCERL